MPHLFSLLVLALAVSLDGFGTGAMYGLRKIRIPFLSVFIITTLSGLVFFVSMQIGGGISRFVSPVWASATGAVILIGIGVWAIYQMAVQRDETPGGKVEEERNPNHPVPAMLSIELKRLGLVIQILRTPAAADMDRSGSISPVEAAWLGLALSLDAFGAGIGAALLGFQPVWTSLLIAGSCGMFIWLGLRFGFRFADVRWVRRLSVLPGCILILMGVMKLM